MSDEDLYLKIRKEATNQHAFQILEALLVFNKHVLKCNFYQPTSTSIIASYLIVSGRRMRDR